MKNRTRKAMKCNAKRRNVLKLDPSRTLDLRRGFVNDLTKRWKLLKGRIVKAFADDLFGLEQVRNEYNPDQPRDAMGRFGHGTSVLTHATEFVKHLSAALYDRIKAGVSKRYGKLEARYGPRYAKAIIGAALVGIPIPLPGASVMAAAPVIALAELHRFTVLRMSRNIDWFHESGAMSEQDIQAAARELVREVYAEFDQEPPPPVVWPTENAGPEDEPRDEHGRWTTGSSHEGSTEEGSSVRKVAERVIDRLGISRDKLVFQAGIKIDKVTNRPFKAEYSPTRDKIIVYPDAIDNPETVAGILAHEAQHDVTLKAIRQVYDRAPMKAKAVSDLGKFIHPFTQMQMEEGGRDISRYAAEHWDLAKANGYQFQSVRLAVEETLSEMAHVREKTGILPGNDRWKALFNEIHQTYVTGTLKIGSGRYKVSSGETRGRGKKMEFFTRVEDSGGNVRQMTEDEVEALARNTKPEWVTNAPLYDFPTDVDRIRVFRDWLRTQFKEVGLTDRQLFERYAQAAFRRGQARAFDDANAVKRAQLYGHDDQLDFYEGAKGDFLRSSFARPVSVERVGHLVERSFSDMDGVTDEVETRMVRVLSDGLATGKSPRDVARDLDDVTDLGRERSLTIARTEIIRAHAEGQLTGLEALGVEEVGVAVEWAVTPDEKLCDLCAPLQGVVLKIDEARGMLPRHPNAVFAGSSFATYGPCLDFVRAKYRGPCIKLTTAGGRVDGFPIGPNHPILTDRGMVKAADLRKGDQILYDLRQDRPPEIDAVDFEQVPSVEDVFESCLAIGGYSGISPSGSDLHGDRVFCQGEVEAVSPDGGLLRVRQSGRIEELREYFLVRPDAGSQAVSGPRPGFDGCLGVLLPPSGGMGSSDPWVPADPHFVWLRLEKVEVGEFTGLAFDCTTGSSLYCSGGIVVSNCRCAWIPANVGEDDDGQKRSRGEVEGAFEESGIDREVDGDRPVANYDPDQPRDEHGRWLGTKAGLDSHLQAEYGRLWGGQGGKMKAAEKKARERQYHADLAHLQGMGDAPAPAPTPAAKAPTPSDSKGDTTPHHEQVMSAVEAADPGTNFVPLADVRARLGHLSRADQDAAITHLRKAGRIRLKSTEFLDDRTVAAGIHEAGEVLGYVTRPPGANRSFFADCDRDERGRCLPGDGADRVSDRELRAVQKKAREKAKKTTPPTPEELAKNLAGIAAKGANKYRRDLVGNKYNRADRRKELYKEFGDGKTCPCVYCGIKLGEGTMEQDKIFTTKEGGRYRLDNLVPSCKPCNGARGDTPWGKIKWPR